MGKTINRNLGLLLAGQFISQIGDKFYALALSFWVLQWTGSPVKMGVVLFASMVPSVVLGFFIGGFIDRFNRKTILMAADAFRGLIVVAVTAVYYSGGLNLAVIVTAQVLLSAASAFFNPAALAVVPQIVPDERLVKANAASQFLSGTAGIVGPLLGGLAVSFLGYLFVFAFNALSFFLSAACVAPMRLQARPASAGSMRVKESLRQGYAYIFRQRKIVVLLGVVAVVHFFVGSIQVIMPVLATVLRGDGAQNFGYIETAMGLGTVAAALLLQALKLRGKESAGIFAGIAGIGSVTAAAGMLLSLGVNTVTPFLAAFFLMSGAVIFIATSYTVILQSTIANDMAGRVFGIIGSVGNFTLPLSVLVFGALLGVMPAGVILISCGAFMLLVCLALACAYRAGKAPLTAGDGNPGADAIPPLR